MKLFVGYHVKKKPVTPSWIKRVSSLVLKAVKGAPFERRSELSVVLTGDGEVKRLNHQYRGKNRTTDVLAFPLLGGAVMPRRTTGTEPLGDVVISIPQTKRQSVEHGTAFRGELALLLTHGILHLLGYDHVTKAQEKKMFGLQEKILKRVKF